MIIINAIGLFFSFLAIKESLGLGNRFLFRICSSINKGNCNQVIKSNVANLFYNITYSDLSFIFYIYSFIISFFVTSFIKIISLNILFIPLSLAIIVYSLYQQKFIIKRWCLLCIGISFVSLIQFIILSIYYCNITYIDYRYILLSALIFFTFFVIWNVLKPIVKDYTELLFEKFEKIKLYKDKEVFQLLLEKEPIILEKDFKKLSLIKLNNANSSFDLTLVLSPNCEYCKHEYRKFRELMFYYNEKINFNILFYFEMEDIEKKIITIVKNFYYFKDKTFVVNAIDDFFIENYSVNKWLSKGNKTSYTFTNTIFTNLGFLKKYNITNVPCLLVNNHLYPKGYNIDDIKYFLNDLIKLNKK